MQGGNYIIYCNYIYHLGVNDYLTGFERIEGSRWVCLKKYFRWKDCKNCSYYWTIPKGRNLNDSKGGSKLGKKIYRYWFFRFLYSQPPDPPFSTSGRCLPVTFSLFYVDVYQGDWGLIAISFLLERTNTALVNSALCIHSLFTDSSLAFNQKTSLLSLQSGPEASGKKL